MYINSLEIDKYQILEDLKIEFQIPKDNKSVVNVIAGVNGSGKTTLLNWILYRIVWNIKSSKVNNGKLVRDDGIIINENNFTKTVLEFNLENIDNNKYENGIHSSPRVIFIPSNMTFNYQSKSSMNNSYEFSNIINTNDIVGNAELYIKNFIIDNERRSTKSNPQERTIDAVEKFNSIFRDSEFITKLVNLDEFNQNRPIFQTINGDTVTIDQLSSGEQQLYARVVSLMILNPHNSVILIDEPEIALHPTWQIDIMKIYENIGENNQFIVTTHSPFIISQTPYKNLIFLVKEDEKIVARNFIQPLDNIDINTVVETMGANSELVELIKLQEEYQNLFDENKENTEEAEELKKRIREYESANSSFWQGIAFDKALR